MELKSCRARRSERPLSSPSLFCSREARCWRRLFIVEHVTAEIMALDEYYDYAQVHN
jgi:hypothetical protein